MRWEEHCKQISLACVGSAHSVSAALGLPPLTADVCAFMVSTSQVLGCSARNCLRRALGCMHFPGLNCSGSGAQVHVLRYSSEVQTQLDLRFVPFPGPSSSGDDVFGEHSSCDLSPPLSLPLSFLGVQPARLLRRTLTVQNPKKT